ncbi:MAG: hypothetical protein QOF77_1814 [Solirubrobacteraceae bacterium]|jgi:hypothetical protein|nr:hypothetical protein [Solirubrobacteraceae bacterium]
MSTEDERPKRSDQLPEDGPESVVADDVPAADSRSAEADVRQGDGDPGGSGGGAGTGPGGAAGSGDGDGDRLDGTP